MAPAEFVSAAGERRFLALLAVSALLHALALAWVKMPATPLAAPAMLAVLNASLRVAIGVAAPATETPPARAQAQPPVRPEARQSPARREPRALPAALETAGPTTAPSAAAPVVTTGAATPLAAPASVAAAEPVAPAAAAPAPAPAADAAHQLDNYGQRLSELFSRQQQYPRLAAQRGWEGEVRVRLSVARQGSLTAVRLERSSGFEVLDRHALAMIEEIGRLPPPPAEFSGEVQVVVPVHYKLKKPA